MKKLYSKCLGTRIISQSQNRQIGIVKHLFINTDNGKITAVLLNLLSSEVILTMDIIKWTDIILVQSKEEIVTIDEIARLKELKEKNQYIITKKVETERGVKLGRIYDYEFDLKNFKLSKISVRKAVLGLFFPKYYLISTRNIVDIREDKVIVKDAVIKEPNFKLSKKLSVNY